MRFPALLVVAVLLVTGCGTEAAGTMPATEPTTPAAPPSPPPTPAAPPSPPPTPELTRPVFPTKLPSRRPNPASAYQQLTVHRLTEPDTSLRAPAAGFAQVVLACDYEEWSLQDEQNTRERMPPNNRSGDYLSARTRTRTREALGSHGDPMAADYFARSFTKDSWPTRKLVTTYDVARANLTRANVVAARNAYAEGCSARYVPPLLDAVRVSVYAPWAWKL
ncbi:hypothetical protein BWI15_26200 [Kribbella sp. ALI-6-A]|uniref:hypothetical protein n=1 Tax=Kribbella sp. ALI-6-A TaxID=1933817 RepID=UPI00097C5184|nr:hypothetical protein [Kribbella sp. ALI-6-A]ONI69998.1 hypothetical protein BWI15_26200 [Kribbella sp. ALI-6-A]